MADILPAGVLYRPFPAATHRLVDPPAQLSVLRLLPSYYRQSLIRTAKNRRLDPISQKIIDRYADAHVFMADKLREQGLPDMERQENFSALLIDPGQPSALKNIGISALSEKNPQRARVFLERASERAPEDVEIRYRLGLAWRAAARPEPALHQFKNVLAKFPTHVQSLFQAADVLEGMKKPSEAAHYWEQLARLEPKNKVILWRLSRCLAALERLTDAELALNRYLLLEISDEERAQAETLKESLGAPPAPAL